MDRLALRAAPEESRLHLPSWSYWRPESTDVVELGTVHGHGAALPTHFHEEAQLTFVLSGRRRFLLPGGPVELSPGCGVIIPPGVPHRSDAEPVDVVCFNAYLEAGEYAAPTLIAAIGALWRREGCIPWAEVTALIGAHRVSDTPSRGPRPVGAVEVTAAATVRQLADRAGMSREGYSRMFRRQYGVSPQVYLLTRRLNQARRLLRDRVAIAEVAAVAGFADQSHLGRWFRRAFGTTPGRYRRS